MRHILALPAALSSEAQLDAQLSWRHFAWLWLRRVVSSRLYAQGMVLFGTELAGLKA